MSEQEITRAEQERYDLETLARYELLAKRLVAGGLVTPFFVDVAKSWGKDALRQLSTLYVKEGY